MKQLQDHGGNINVARALYPDAPSPWIDLSTGINPVPYAIGTIPEVAWTRLPEPEALTLLETTAANAYSADPYAEIVAASGTQAFIQVLPRLLDARNVGIVNFTYTEHERCWRAAGAQVTVVDKLSDLARFQVGIVVNPNNPDGTLHSTEKLAAVGMALQRRGGSLIVDEAFMDVIEHGFSMTSVISQFDAVILRSFGKTYGLAGLRLGFALTNRRLGGKLREALGPWAVSGPAIDVASRALNDKAWLKTSIARLRNDCDRLDRMLEAAGFEILGGSPLFRLTHSTHSQFWFQSLCHHGILTRPFHKKPNWLRFGIPHQTEQWKRLQACLDTCAESQ